VHRITGAHSSSSFNRDVARAALEHSPRSAGPVGLVSCHSEQNMHSMRNMQNMQNMLTMQTMRHVRINPVTWTDANRAASSGDLDRVHFPAGRFASDDIAIVDLEDV
jgi:hypothetical protein